MNTPTNESVTVSHNVSPSISPRGITWPLVAYMFVRELTYIVAIITGGTVAVVILLKAPEKTIEPLVSAIAPVLFTILGKSRPSEPLDLTKLTGGASLFALLFRNKLGL